MQNAQLDLRLEADLTALHLAMVGKPRHFVFRSAVMNLKIQPVGVGGP